MADIEDLNPGEVASALAKAGLDATLRAHTVPTSWTPVDSVDLMAMGEGRFQVQCCDVGAGLQIVGVAYVSKEDAMLATFINHTRVSP